LQIELKKIKEGSSSLLKKIKDEHKNESCEHDLKSTEGHKNNSVLFQKPENTYTYNQGEYTPAEETKKDSFFLMRIKGHSLDKVQNKTSKFNEILKSYLKVLNLEGKGRATMHVLNNAQKSNFVFAGYQNALKLNYIICSGHKTSYNFNVF
jgi:hypothetical protein